MFILPGQEIALTNITDKEALTLKNFKNSENEISSVIQLEINNKTIEIYEPKNLCYDIFNLLSNEKILNQEQIDVIKYLKKSGKLIIAYITPKDVLTLTTITNMSLYNVEQQRIFPLNINDKIILLIQTIEPVSANIHFAKDLIYNIAKGIVRYNIKNHNIDCPIIKEKLLQIRRWYYKFIELLINRYVGKEKNEKVLTLIIDKLSKLWLNLLYKYNPKTLSFNNFKKKVLHLLLSIPYMILKKFRNDRIKETLTKNTEIKTTKFMGNDFDYIHKLSNFKNEFILPMISLFEKDMYEPAILYANKEYETILDIIKTCYIDLVDKDISSNIHKTIGMELIHCHLIAENILSEEEGLEIIKMLPNGNLMEF